MGGRSATAAFAIACSGFFAPGMAVETALLMRIHLSANCAIVEPSGFAAARSLTASRPVSNGTPAKVFTYEWTWSDGFTELVTGALITIKGGKYFSSTATTIVGGETSPEKLVEMVKGWKFY